MTQIKMFFKGLIIGLGKIIPGVSGSIFAILFGVYEPIIESLANIKNIKKNFNLLFPLGTGIIFAIMFGSNFIDFLLSNYYLVSMSFFIGLMSYGLIPLINSVKNSTFNLSEIIISILVVISITMLIFVKFDVMIVNNNNSLKEFISLILCGLLDAISTIVPGISGTAILLILGYYEIIIKALANPLISINILIPFFFVFIVGLIIVAKLIDYLFKKYKNIMNFSILSFSIISIVYLIINVIDKMTSINIIYPLIALFVGGIISYLLESINQ